ncbi:unnamed protein product [Urochloa humidicola]
MQLKWKSICLRFSQFLKSNACNVAQAAACDNGSASKYFTSLGKLSSASAFFVSSLSSIDQAEAPTDYPGSAHTVGDYGGWKFNVDRWANGRTFRAGNELVFNYNRAVHDVAVVDAAAYRSCVVPRGARVLRSGRDKVRLGRGTHYFVCTVPGHCHAGMIAVRGV